MRPVKYVRSADSEENGFFMGSIQNQPSATPQYSEGERLDSVRRFSQIEARFLMNGVLIIIFRKALLTEHWVYVMMNDDRILQLARAFFDRVDLDPNPAPNFTGV